MAMMVVDDSGLQADSQRTSVGLVWVSVGAGRRVICIHRV